MSPVSHLFLEDSMTSRLCLLIYFLALNACTIAPVVEPDPVLPVKKLQLECGEELCVELDTQFGYGIVNMLSTDRQAELNFSFQYKEGEPGYSWQILVQDAVFLPWDFYFLFHEGDTVRKISWPSPISWDDGQRYDGAAHMWQLEGNRPKRRSLCEDEPVHRPYEIGGEHFPAIDMLDLFASADRLVLNRCNEGLRCGRTWRREFDLPTIQRALKPFLP